MKKLLAMLLVLCLVMTALVGCGSKDEEDDDSSGKKDNTPKVENQSGDEESGDKESGDKESGNKEEETKTLDSVIEAMSGEFKKGTITYGLDFDVNLEGEAGQGKISYIAKVDGKNLAASLSMDVNMDGMQMKFTTPEVAVVYDGVLYLNLGGILKVASQIAEMPFDIEGLEWFALPLPDEFASMSADEDLQKAVLALTKSLLAAGKAEDMTVTFNEADHYVNAIEAIAVFVETSLGDFVEESMSMSTAIDLNAYVNKLIDFYYEEAVEAIESMGMTKEDLGLDEMIDQLKAMDLNALLESELEGGMDVEMPDFGELAAELRELKTELAEDYADAEVKPVIVLTGENDKDIVKFSASLSGESDTEKVVIGISAEMKSENVSVEKPDKVTSLSEIAAIIMELAYGGMGEYEGDEDTEW